MWTTLPIVVAHDLDLDVARLLEVLLDVHRAVAEGRQRFVLGQPEELGELLGVVRDPHALPAAAGGGLDDDRKADLVGERPAPRPRPRSCPGEPGTVGTPASCCQPPGGGLVAHLADLIAGGADEGDVASLAGLGELGVLRQEAVARVDRVGAGDLRGGDDVGDAGGRAAAGRGPDADVVVGEADVERLAVGLAVDGHRLDPQLPAGPDDPQGDFPAVGDEDLLKHAGRPSRSSGRQIQRPRHVGVAGDLGELPVGRRIHAGHPQARTRSGWWSRTGRSRRRSSRP